MSVKGRARSSLFMAGLCQLQLHAQAYRSGKQWQTVAHRRYRNPLLQPQVIMNVSMW